VDLDRALGTADSSSSRTTRRWGSSRERDAAAARMTTASCRVGAGRRRQWAAAGRPPGWSAIRREVARESGEQSWRPRTLSVWRMLGMRAGFGSDPPLRLTVWCSAAGFGLLAEQSVRTNECTVNIVHVAHANPAVPLPKIARYSRAIYAKLLPCLVHPENQKIFKILRQPFSKCIKH